MISQVQKRYWISTAACLVAIGIAVLLAPQLKGAIKEAEPSSAFLKRRLCTFWAGQCQTYSLTVGTLLTFCKSKGQAKWEALTETSAILRCVETDKLSRRTNEISFQFETYEDKRASSGKVRNNAPRGTYLDRPIWNDERRPGITVQGLVDVCTDEGGVALLDGIPGGARNDVLFQCVYDEALVSNRFASVSGLAFDGLPFGLNTTSTITVISHIDAMARDLTARMEASAGTEKIAVAACTAANCYFRLGGWISKTGQELDDAGMAAALQEKERTWKARRP